MQWGFIFVSLVIIVKCEAFDFWRNVKVNCGVSVWSAWSSPAADGSQTRTRTILREPRNGGSLCPDLVETRDSSQDSNAWDRNDLPRKFHNEFMSGHSHYYSFDLKSGAAGGDDSDGLTLLPRDLLFIIDMSGSIKSSDWTLTKSKLADLIERLCGTVGSGIQDNRISIITFSDRVVLNFNFQTHWDIASIRRAILSMPQARGSTCTGDAFHYAHFYMFNPNTGIRSATESIKEVLVLTDGHSNCGADLAEQVRILQVKAFVFALAIGNYSTTGRAEIESMVSRPLINHIFSLKNFIEFRRMVDIIATYPSKCAPFELSK